MRTDFGSVRMDTTLDLSALGPTGIGSYAPSPQTGNGQPKPPVSTTVPSMKRRYVAAPVPQDRRSDMTRLTRFSRETIPRQVSFAAAVASSRRHR